MVKETLIYFLYGEDRFRIAREIDKIKSGILKKEQTDFNYDRLVSPSVEDFLSIANSYPVFSERRIIQIEDFDDSFLNDTDILDYIKSPLKTTLVILYSYSPKINENIKFFKELKGADYFKLTKIRLLYESELPSYIKNLSKEKTVKISDEAIYYLIRYTGNNTLNIDNELDKIASGIKPENKTKELSAADLKPFLSLSKAFNVFDFTDKILERDTGGAFSIFGIIYDDGEEPVKIVSILYNEIRKLHKAKVQESLGTDLETILQTSLILPFLKKKFINRMSLFTLYELKSIMGLLEETDLKLKTSSYPQDLIFEELIFKFAALNNKNKQHRA